MGNEPLEIWGMNTLTTQSKGQKGTSGAALGLPLKLILGVPNFDARLLNGANLSERV